MYIQNAQRRVVDIHKIFIDFPKLFVSAQISIDVVFVNMCQAILIPVSNGWCLFGVQLLLRALM